MVHPATELRIVDPRTGYGVVATAPIPTGTLTWVLDPFDQVLQPDQFLDLDGRSAAILEKYSWLTASGQRILCWDFGRFMNHSCRPNSMGVGSDFEVAIRDIAVGEQLTNDYVTLNVERPFTCYCRQRCCRRRIYPEDIEALAAAYDAMVSHAIKAIPHVTQPLLGWVKDRRRLTRLARGHEPMPSVLAQRFPPHDMNRSIPLDQREGTGG